jgi:putative peptidoglycan lipid II flippase
VNLGLNLWLNALMGYRGLALGTAISANVNAGLLLYLLSQRIGGVEFPRILRAFWKVSVASAVMGGTAYFSQAWLHGVLPDPTLLHRLVRVTGAIGISLGVLAAAAHLLRLEEFGVAMSRALGRFRR